jgi:Flp pilus assembly pilin Flp
MKYHLPDFHHRQEAQTLVEYALILSFVVIVLVTVLTAFGGAIGALFATVVAAL